MLCNFIKKRKMNQVLNNQDLLKIIALKTDFFTQISMTKVCQKWNVVVRECIMFKPVDNWRKKVDSEPFGYLDLFDTEDNFEWVGAKEYKKSFEELSSMVKKNKPFTNDSLNFVLTNIDDIYFYQNGVHDEEDWYLFGKMENVWFFMAASCDYTGFDCRGSIRFYFSEEPYSLIKFGMTDQSRKQFTKFLKTLN